MLFFGWGRKSVRKQINESQVLLCQYGYFSVMFVFMVAMDYKYTVATLKGQEWSYRDITKEESVQLNNGEQLYPHIWWRFSLLAAIALIVLGGIISSLTSSVSGA